MKSRCVNPLCSQDAGFFGAGDLYALQGPETAHPRRAIRYIWLCASCAADHSVQTDGRGKIIVVPRFHRNPSKARDVPNRLRLVLRSNSVPLPLDRPAARESICS
jgi:hypothetical protein